VHHEKIAFTAFFPAQWRPPQVSNTIGRKSTLLRPNYSALSRFFVSSCAEKRSGAAAQGPAAGRNWVQNGQIQRSCLPSHALSRISAFAGCMVSGSPPPRVITSGGCLFASGLASAIECKERPRRKATYSLSLA